jgi:uncharacterized RDD family membrane protein YckC
MSDTPPPPPPPPLPPEGAGFGPTTDTAAEQPLASAGRRVGARLLDGIIVNLVIGGLVTAAIAGDSSGTVGTGDADTGDLLVASIVMLVIWFLWDAVCTKVFGGTPMKRAFRMRVVQAESGADLEWRHALIRWGTLAVWIVVPILSLFVPIVLAVVSLVFIFSKPRRQAVWDLTAKTVVVQE